MTQAPPNDVHSLLHGPEVTAPRGDASTQGPPIQPPLSHVVLSGNGRRGPIAPPRRTRDFGMTGVALAAASVAASFAAVWILFYQLTLMSGAFGFAVCWYIGFLITFWLVTTLTVDRPAATDRLVTIMLGSCAAVVIGLLFYIIFYVFLRGIAHFTLGFLWRTLAFYQPANPHDLNNVGVGHAIVGTLEQVALASLMAVPLAVLTAVFLNEVGGFGTRFVRTIVTAMSGVPSVVAGVFIYATLIKTGVLGYSGFAAAIALFVLMLPSVTRTTEEVLRVVPGGLREASLALGASEWRTVRQVVLPTARSGLITAVVLGVAIASGETAPLIFTAFGANIMNPNPLHGPQGALPLVLYENIFQAQPVPVQLAFTAGFVLMTLVLFLFVLARLLGRRSAKRGSVRRFVSASVNRIRGT